MLFSGRTPSWTSFWRRLPSHCFRSASSAPPSTRPIWMPSVFADSMILGCDGVGPKVCSRGGRPSLSVGLRSSTVSKLVSLPLPLPGETREIRQSLLGYRRMCRTVWQVCWRSSIRSVPRSRRVRASTVKTFEGAEVIVPNGQLVSARVVNWTLSDRTRRIDILVGVAYGTSPSAVIDLLLATAANQEDLRSNPEPVALFKGFGESSLDFELRIWTNEFLNWRQVASDVTVAVNDALVEAGMEIPFPQRDLHVRSIDEDVAAKMLKPGRKP